MTDLGSQLGDFLAQLILSGFTLPVHVAAVASNGTHAVVRMDGQAVEFLCEPKGNFELPINAMFVDRRGEAARALIGPSGSIVQ